MAISTKQNATLLDYCEVLYRIHYYFTTNKICMYSLSKHPLEQGYSINNASGKSWKDAVGLWVDRVYTVSFQ